MDFGCKVTKKYPNYRIFGEKIGENGVKQAKWNTISLHYNFPSST